MKVEFTIHGIARPAGSKKAFYNPKLGRSMVVDANDNSRPWKALVSDAAQRAMSFDGDDGTNGYRPLLAGPLALELLFYVPRPKGHFGARGLKPSAPEFPTVKPDVLKLARAVEDALSGIVYRDDAQIVTESLLKRYGEPARCVVLVRTEAAQQEVIAAA